MGKRKRSGDSDQSPLAGLGDLSPSKAIQEHNRTAVPTTENTLQQAKRKESKK